MSCTQDKKGLFKGSEGKTVPLNGVIVVEGAMVMQ